MGHNHLSRKNIPVSDYTSDKEKFLISSLNLPRCSFETFPQILLMDTREISTKLNHGQQVEGGDSAPLLCSGETPPGVLRPALDVPSAQERHGTVGAGTEEGHKNDLRAGAPLLGGRAERPGVVAPGEEKAAGRPSCGLSVLQGGL